MNSDICGIYALLASDRVNINILYVLHIYYFFFIIIVFKVVTDEGQDAFDLIID